MVSTQTKQSMLGCYKVRELSVDTRNLSAAPESALDALYQRPGFLLRRAHQLSVALFEQHCRALALTPPQFGVLKVLSHIQDIDQARLAKGMGYDKVTILHVVRGLEGRGLLSRTPHPHDGRRMALRLTEAGRALLEQARQCASEAYAQLVSPLAPQEQHQLLDLLQRLCDELEPFARAPMHKLRIDPS